MQTEQWILLQNVVNITFFRKRHLDSASYFCMESDICFCSDINRLMRSFDQDCVASEWMLFIHSNKTSPKAVLLHNGNEKPLIPVAYSTKSKEAYKSIQNLLACIGYEEHKSHICRDLKVVSLLLSLQLGYT